MKRIRIVGEEGYTTMTDTEYEQYLESTRDPKIKMVKVGNKEVHRSKIQEIKHQEKRFNIDTSPEAMKKFEKEIEEIKTKPLRKELTFYGDDHSKAKTVELTGYKFTENPHRVYNPVLGLIDARIVEHCLDKGYITRFKNKYWGIGQNLDGYVEFVEKSSALSDIKEKRAYAQNKNLEGVVEKMGEGVKPNIIKNNDIKPVQIIKSDEPVDISLDEIPL